MARISFFPHLIELATGEKTLLQRHTASLLRRIVEYSESFLPLSQTTPGDGMVLHLADKTSASTISPAKGLKNLDKPAVLVFPKLLVCLDCGFTEFTMAETELGLLGAGVAA